jgi:hypothetical protein
MERKYDSGKKEVTPDSKESWVLRELEPQEEPADFPETPPKEAPEYEENTSESSGSGNYVPGEPQNYPGSSGSDGGYCEDEESPDEMFELKHSPSPSPS